MSNYSEGGRDICAAGDLRGEFLGCSFSQYRMERGIKLSLDDGVLSILLTDDQPARQVVMPEYERNHAGLIVESVHSPWNAALDAVAHLNRRAVPVELLERIQVELDDYHSMDLIGTHGCDDELRVLLGKD